MPTVKVLAKGQIVIPAATRRGFDIKPGDELQLFEYGNIIYLVPPTSDPVADGHGCLPGQPSLAKELLAERQSDFPQ